MKNIQLTGKNRGFSFRQSVLFFIIVESVALLAGMFFSFFAILSLIPVALFFMSLTMSGDKINPVKYGHLFVPFVLISFFSISSEIEAGGEIARRIGVEKAGITYAVMLIGLVFVIVRNIREKHRGNDFVAQYALFVQSILFSLLYAFTFLVIVFISNPEVTFSSWPTSVAFNLKEFLSLLLLAGIFLKAVFLVKNNKGKLSGQSAELTSEEIEECEQRLAFLFEERKIYRRHDLDKEMISRRTGFSIAQLDYVWEYLGKDYFTFVAEYRIAYALELMDKHGKCAKCLDSISYESGYKSRATFDKYFYRVTNQHPSEYTPKISFAFIL